MNRERVLQEQHIGELLKGAGTGRVPSAALHPLLRLRQRQRVRQPGPDRVAARARQVCGNLDSIPKDRHEEIERILCRTNTKSQVRTQKINLRIVSRPSNQQCFR